MYTPIRSPEYIRTGSAIVPETPDAGGSRMDCFRQLRSIASTRFCHEDFALIIFSPSATKEAAPTGDSPSDLTAAVEVLSLESTSTSKELPLLGDIHVSRFR